MLVDANSLPERSVVEADVCIVGAGPAGLTLARELSGERFRVCVVESGGTGYEAETQDLARMARTESDLVPAHQNRRRQLGGNAHMWRLGRRPSRSLVRHLPLDEIDLVHRPWVPHSGWPFARSALDAYYARAHRLLGIGQYDYALALAAGEGGHALPLDSEHVRTSVEWFGTSRPFVRSCLGELRRSANVTLLSHATAGVLEEQSAGERIERLRVDCLTGRSHAVTASVFVLAAGGIENPRLLLLSDIGNTHDVVGRFFMDHLLVRGVLVPADPRLFETSALYDVREIADGRVVGCKLNLTAAVMERERLLNAALKLEARIPSRPLLKALDTRARLMLRSRQLVPSLNGWSALHGNARRFREFSAYLQIELAPDPANRVTLAAERDRFDRPRAAVRWKWDELSRRSALRTGQLLAASFARAGLGRLEMPQDDPPPLAHREGCNHHMGTTRMHVDPKQGVVDHDCRVHGVPNLFVAGSSVFPTGGYANSTLTIVALSIRLADHLRRVMRRAATSLP